MSSTFLTMGWLRLVGSLKYYVSFAKEPCKTDDILHICKTCEDNVICHMMSSTFLTMEWLRLVGSLKSYVSFAKEPYRNDDILHICETCESFDLHMSHSNLLFYDGVTTYFIKEL